MLRTPAFAVSSSTVLRTLGAPGWGTRDMFSQLNIILGEKKKSPVSSFRVSFRPRKGEDNSPDVQREVAILVCWKIQGVQCSSASGNVQRVETDNVGQVAKAVRFHQTRYAVHHGLGISFVVVTCQRVKPVEVVVVFIALDAVDAIAVLSED